ncbi:hypothetical protein OZX67_09430 [Bifidobacterium sp. ESL0728]|uniref:hypothetical protein n=1 Tax=Bifidobacterium sp. ESL0728 TaxID=2983220 RepID=UPI0023F9754A|nr:hypothetical protein [Bifidobacterium sp. ESL0728]WEV58988.1 hypothetical protein OZX67_09430 [Bifidobacterium sp. ESL0728]
MTSPDILNGVDMRQQPPEVRKLVASISRDQEEIRKVMRQEHEYFNKRANAKN